MGKATSDAVFDAALDKIATGNIMTLCSAQPTNRTEAVTTYALADVAMAGGDYTKADGAVSGRKTTVGAKSSVPVDTSGTATHVAICDGSILLIVTTCTSQAVTSGNTVNFPVWSAELNDPT